LVIGTAVINTHTSIE
jgi:hypothetical protein